MKLGQALQLFPSARDADPTFLATEIHMISVYSTRDSHWGIRLSGPACGLNVDMVYDEREGASLSAQLGIVQSPKARYDFQAIIPTRYLCFADVLVFLDQTGLTRWQIEPNFEKHALSSQICTYAMFASIVSASEIFGFRSNAELQLALSEVPVQRSQSGKGNMEPAWTAFRTWRLAVNYDFEPCTPGVVERYICDQRNEDFVERLSARLEHESFSRIVSCGDLEGWFERLKVALEPYMTDEHNRSQGMTADPSDRGIADLRRLVKRSLRVNTDV